MRVAIVGCGNIAELHVRAWRNIGAKIVAVCDKNISLANSKASKWKVPKYYKDVEKMAQDEKIEVASICTPPNVRLNVIKPLVENGIHIVIEKPFTMSISEAEKIVELKNKCKLKITVVHNWLFSYIMQRTLRHLNREEIGDIVSVDMTLLHTKDDPMAANPTHWSHKLLAGRFGELLPHPIYTIRAIVGNVRVKDILGSKTGNYPWMPIDNLYILLEGEKGKTASVYISFNTPRPETTLRIFGTKAVYYVNLSNNILIKKRYRKITMYQIFIDNLRFLTDIMGSSFMSGFAILTKRYQGMHTEFIKKFVDSIVNDTEPPVSVEEALEVVKLHLELSSKIHELYFPS